MTDEEREALKETMRQLLVELINEAQQPEAQPEIDEENDPATFFANTSAMISDAQWKYNDLGGKVNERVAYLMLAFLIENAVEFGILEDDDEWDKIVTLFKQRAEEVAGKSDDADLPIVDDPVRWISALNTIVDTWISGSQKYSSNGFADHERIFLIREILIHLRNQHILNYDSWLKSLLADLLVDWQVMGGGASGSIGGQPPFSWAGQ